MRFAFEIISELDRIVFNNDQPAEYHTPYNGVTKTLEKEFARPLSIDAD